MRFAYADPPYPGQEHRYAITTGVNHRLLVANLAPHARVASWVKTYASNGWSRVRWSWEPVLFVTPRRGLKPGETSMVWDSLVCAPVHNGPSWGEVGVPGGEKPYTFVRWVMEILGMDSDDELVDIFPGSGAVSRHAKVETLELFAPVAAVVEQP
jgi:hypothetical protein